MLTVLVVDDEKLVRWSLTHHLRKSGYTVTAAESAESALEELEKRDFDVVITDIRLPGMNGIELAEKLHSSQPKTRVVMITAYDSPEYRERAAELGIRDYLKKPFPMSAISTVLQNCVRPRRSGPPTGHGDGAACASM